MAFKSDKQRKGFFGAKGNNKSQSISSNISRVKSKYNRDYDLAMNRYETNPEFKSKLDKYFKYDKIEDRIETKKDSGKKLTPKDKMVYLNAVNRKEQVLTNMSLNDARALAVIRRARILIP